MNKTVKEITTETVVPPYTFFDKPVKVIQAGRIVDVIELSHINEKATVRKLSSNEYLVVRTNEIRQYKNHTESRRENMDGIKRSQRKLRGIINANFQSTWQTHWCTLTYAENMTDRKRLMTDYHRFTTNFSYFCKTKEYPYPAMVAVPEPQGRGAWHIHLLMFWNIPIAPFIPNDTLQSLWGHGFVNIKRLKPDSEIENLGSYLTTYLCDMTVEECHTANMSYDSQNIVGKGEKSIVKGARLSLYPAGCRLYYLSGKIKRPVENWVCREDVRWFLQGVKKRRIKIVNKIRTGIRENGIASFVLWVRRCQYLKSDTDINYVGFLRTDKNDLPDTFGQNK